MDFNDLQDSLQLLELHDYRKIIKSQNKIIQSLTFKLQFIYLLGVFSFLTNLGMYVIILQK